jgi:uncharacterized short protein YbdD (DUF466 family)
MTLATRLVETLRLMVGVPDYRRYVEHRRARHAGEPVLTEAEFIAQRQAARYGEGADSTPRCC